MSNFRKGDKVKLGSDVVAEVGADGGTVRVGDTWLFAKDLELVERPGPRLEDLPDGTVISAVTDENRRATPYVRVGHGVTAIVDINEEHGFLLRDFAWPFEVIGACPGTPAWELWLAAGELDTDDRGEWWRTA